MKVKINQIELTNFRNIDHAVYDLSDVCVIEGQNHIGKTNIMLSAYWCLTDKMLDGRSDSMSLKPLKDTTQKVSVKLTLDCDGTQHTIQKSYFENWSKKRGSSELSLTGHTTEYIIDDIKIKTVNEALKEIATIIEVDPSKYFELNKIDMVQALMNPYYLGSILEWKQLRELIVNIIGDVENNEVYAKEPATIEAKEVLTKYNYDFNKALTFLNQSIANATVSIKANETLLEDLQKCEDLPEDEVKNAQSKVAEINEKLSNIDNNGTLDNNPQIEEYEGQIKVLKLKAQEISNQLTNDYNMAMDAYNTKSEIKRKKIDEINQEMLDLKGSEILNKLGNLQYDAHSLSKKIEDKKEEKENLLKSYHITKDKTFNEPEIKCPNCGAVLNADDIQKRKELFESVKQENLDIIVSKGKQLALEIENYTKQLEGINQDLKLAEDQYNESQLKLVEVQKRLEDARNDYFNLEKPSRITTNPELEEINLKVTGLNNKINLIKSTPNQDLENQKFILQQAKDGYEETLATHYAFIANQKRLEELNLTLQKITQEKVSAEIQKESLQLFQKTKLDMLDSKLDAAFGDVKFVLITSNITEGSWNQVCYPKIIGKDTPFINGSPSEKIVTGIKVIEAFKKLLNLADLPILVDEIGQLDNLSIEHLKAFTNAQIVSTRVSNDYSQPTIVNI